MTYEEVINYFKTGMAAAKAIGVNRTAVYHWKKRGDIPILSQFLLERATKGVLKADKKIRKK